MEAGRPADAVRGPTARQAALTLWLGTSVFVWLALAAGWRWLPPSRLAQPVLVPSGRSLLDALCGGNGQQYLQIARDGYDDPRMGRSTVVFFPVYPLAVRALAWCSGLPLSWAALAVSQALLSGGFCLLGEYFLEEPAPATDANGVASAGLWAFVLCACLPASFFWRLAYSEAAFLFASALVLRGMQARWPLAAIACAAGLASAARPLGACWLLPVLWHAWRRKARTSLIVYAALSLGGLLAYVAFLWVHFGEPLAFATEHAEYNLVAPQPLGDRIWQLLTLQPLLAPFRSDSPTYWGSSLDAPAFWCSLSAANPAWFLLAVGLTAWGASRRRLRVEEALFCSGLLALAYVSRAADNGMFGQARFAACAWPAYKVGGELLARWPRLLSGALLALCLAGLGLYSALFGAGYVLR